MHMNRIILCSSSVQSSNFCSALTVCRLHRGVLHCCCQLLQHFCGFNGPLCQGSASFEVRWMSQDLKNMQDTLLPSLFNGMLSRYSTDGLHWRLSCLKDLAGNHTCGTWSHHMFTFGPKHETASCPPLLFMWINCLGVSRLSLTLQCLNIVTAL